MDGLTIFLVIATIAACVYGHFLWFSLDVLVKRNKALTVRLAAMSEDMRQLATIVQKHERRTSELGAQFVDTWNAADRVLKIERYCNIPGTK